MAAQMGAPPTKITYLSACHDNAQGACAGLFMSPMTGYYYKRDAESLADTKNSGAAMGGTWRDG